MSRAVSMRPDLYAAYLHGASSGRRLCPIAENSVAIYIYMADGDEYYGSAKARSALMRISIKPMKMRVERCQHRPCSAHRNAGQRLLQRKGIYNYHGGANESLMTQTILNWVISHSKG